VFIDSPPLLAVTDASILAAQVEGCLLVIRSGVTRIEEARQAQAQLSKASSRLLGVVLSQVKSDNGNYNQYYY
jgi:protein-tyrosine kinase